MAGKGKGGSRSKAGRPRKFGVERHPGGQIKRDKARAVPVLSPVEAARAFGHDAGGEHPLDYALAKGVITVGQHKTAMGFAGTYRSAHLSAPGLSTQNLGETEAPADVHLVPFANMPGRDVAILWDRLDRRTPRNSDRETSQAAAWERWKAINELLTPGERHQLMWTCVQARMPDWLPIAAAGMQLGPLRRPMFDAFLSGLAKVASVKGKRARPAGPPPAREDFRTVHAPGALAERPVAPAHGPKRSYDTAYVNEGGELLRHVVLRTRRKVED